MTPEECRRLLSIARRLDTCTTDSILTTWGEGSYQIPLNLLRELKEILRNIEPHYPG